MITQPLTVTLCFGKRLRMHINRFYSYLISSKYVFVNKIRNIRNLQRVTLVKRLWKNN